MKQHILAGCALQGFRMHHLTHPPPNKNAKAKAGEAYLTVMVISTGARAKTTYILFINYIEQTTSNIQHRTAITRGRISINQDYSMA
ncbi:MAG: hypothetical protein M3162_08860 [Thermoproteota archaeon]|nr:hypothetical protein [Thermoproteota archaeon]